MCDKQRYQMIAGAQIAGDHHRLEVQISEKCTVFNRLFIQTLVCVIVENYIIFFHCEVSSATLMQLRADAKNQMELYPPGWIQVGLLLSPTPHNCA